MRPYQNSSRAKPERSTFLNATTCPKTIAVICLVYMYAASWLVFLCQQYLTSGMLSAKVEPLQFTGAWESKHFIFQIWLSMNLVPLGEFLDVMNPCSCCNGVESLATHSMDHTLFELIVSSEICMTFNVFICFFVIFSFADLLIAKY